MVSRVGHAGHGVAQRDALVEGGEGAELDPPPQGRLTDQQAANGLCESSSALVSSRSSSSWSAASRWASSSTIDDVPAAFVFLGGEQVGGLRDQRGLVEARDAAEGGDDAG